MRVRHTTLVMISGMIWLMAGLMLLTVGLRLFYSSYGELFSQSTDHLSFLPFLSQGVGSYLSLLFLLAFSLLLGFFKGKYVLKKSALRQISRIMNMENSPLLTSLFSKGYFLLVLLMIGLGISFSFFGMPHDIRAMIDIAVGSALLRGSLYYLNPQWQINH